MAFKMNVGLQGSGTAAGWPGTAGTAAGASAQGPRTIAQQAYGTVAGDTMGPRTSGIALMGGGAFALAAMVFIWWSLPR